jgi:SdpI/YfhL protein family
MFAQAILPRFGWYLTAKAEGHMIAIVRAANDNSSSNIWRCQAMITLMILFTSSGLLLAAVSVPLILRKIGPNPLYGFRVKKTLDDPAVWYPVNAYAAKRLLVVGLGISLSADLLYLVPGMDLLVYAVVCGAVGLGGLLVALIQSVLYLRSFPSHAKS